MNCEEFERELGELEEYSEVSSGFQAHRDACRLCSELVNDLNSIRAQARQMLLGTEQPPERVWEQIHNRLRKAGLIKDIRQAGVFGRAPALGWFSRLTMGMAYAAVFLVAVGVVYVYSILAPRVGPPPLPQPPNPPFAQLFEKVSPDKRAIYVSNLDQVESSIQQLRSYLAAHPEDPFARQELFTTYQQKSRLWEDLVRWQDFSEEAIPQALPASSK